VQEYLSQVWVGGINHISGRDNGYGDFTNVVMSFTRDQNVQGYLSGLVPYPEYEYYSIWIDYNHDNDFTDAGEEVVTLYTDFSGLISFNFTIASNALLGTARMRVIMSHDSPPTPCGVYARGETQDYTVLINDNSTAPPPIPAGLSVSNITSSSATFTWTPEVNAASYHLRYKRTTETTWTIAPVNVTSITVPALSSITDYNFSCQAIGTVGPSGYGATQTFTTAGVALPINDIEITASRQGANVSVNWSTQSEQNSGWFDIQRSYNGIDFIKIGQVQAAGFSSSVRQYRFTDVNAAKSLLFYRLKMADANASYKFSPIIKIAKSGIDEQGFLLYPNPAVNNVSIALNESTKQDLQLKVINQLGQIVKSTRLIKGTHLILLDISGLPGGIYTVTLTGREFVQTKKLIIK
jgi:GEVED domain/Secretion system C-terminal sorting domain/Fibronectin type III domain